MKRLIPLAVVALALAIAPVAFGDDGGSPPAAGQPTAAQTQQGGGDPAHRFAHLRVEVKLEGRRLEMHCGSSANGAPSKCLDAAEKLAQRLQKLDTTIQARIATIRETCGTTTARTRCVGADRRIAALQRIDARTQALLQKVQGWLNGTSTRGDSTLDQAAAGLGQLTVQVGANG